MAQLPLTPGTPRQCGHCGVRWGAPSGALTVAGCGALCRRGQEWMRNRCWGKLGVPEVASSLAYSEQWEDGAGSRGSEI